MGEVILTGDRPEKLLSRLFEMRAEHERLEDQARGNFCRSKNKYLDRTWLERLHYENGFIDAIDVIIDEMHKPLKGGDEDETAQGDSDEGRAYTGKACRAPRSQPANGDPVGE